MKTILDTAEEALRLFTELDVVNENVAAADMDKAREVLAAISAHRASVKGDVAEAILWAKDYIDFHGEDRSIACSHLDTLIAAAQEAATLGERVKELEAKISGGEAKA